jgi:hypothetical protein
VLGSPPEVTRGVEILFLAGQGAGGLARAAGTLLLVARAGAEFEL